MHFGKFQRKILPHLSPKPNFKMIRDLWISAQHMYNRSENIKTSIMNGMPLGIIKKCTHGIKFCPVILKSNWLQLTWPYFRSTWNLTCESSRKYNERQFDEIWLFKKVKEACNSFDDLLTLPIILPLYYPGI